MKKNNSDQYESIMVKLDEFKHPIAFKTKLDELIESGMTAEEARVFIQTTPIELEIYYQKDSGLFAVEAEAVDSGTVYSPYSGEELEEAEEN